MKTKITIIGLIMLIPLFYFIFSFFPGETEARLKTQTAAPDTVFAMDKDTFDISKYKGKTVILNFWASWSKLSRTENKSIVRIYQKYKANPNVVFVSISLDTDESSWKAAIEEDEMIWKAHFCDFKKYESPVAKSYKITTIPVIYLINKKGEIVKSSSKSQEIETEIDVQLK